MKIVVAMDSFKGSLSARRACEVVRRGVLDVLPRADVLVVPMADGGEGTAATFLAAGQGEWIAVEVTGPLPGTRARAGFVWLGERGPGALVEMASANGLELLQPGDLDPLRATTVGTGELLVGALRRGARRLWLAIGGSATVDGGTGAASALGWRFLDELGRDVGLGGEALERVARAVAPESPSYDGAVIDVLCDVDNPLVGPRGAARTFGPQKGATPEVVERLEAGLENLARVIEHDLGLDVRDVPGGGAAGGLGAGAVAFLGAKLVSGVEAVMEAAGLGEALDGADWVLTGEGCLDEGSLHGKVVCGVLARARRAECRVGIVAGTVALDSRRAAAAGVQALERAALPEMEMGEALGRAEELLRAAAARLARAHLDPDV